MLQEKIKASVGILTFNSAKTLRRALESVCEFDDIVICDGGSTDETCSIALEFGARVIRQDALFQDSNGKLIDFGGVRNQCLDAAKYEWFLYIDSDEAISQGLLNEMRSVLLQTNDEKKPLAYRVPIAIHIDGRPVKYSSNYPGYQFRFFNKRSDARFIKTVHERISFDKQKVIVGTFKHPWYVYTDFDEWKHYLREGRRYRDLAVQKASRQPCKNFLYFVWFSLRASAAVGIKSFLIYLMHGFKDSMPVRGEIGRFLDPLFLLLRSSILRIRHFFFHN